MSFESFSINMYIINLFIFFDFLALFPLRLRLLTVQLDRLISNLVCLLEFSQRMQTQVELAQEAVSRAERQVQTAQKELDDLKQSFSLKWFEDNNCIDEGNVFLQTGQWNISLPKHHLDIYLNHSLLQEKENLSFEKKNLSIEKESLARKEQLLIQEEERLARQEEMLILKMKTEENSSSKVDNFLSAKMKNLRLPVEAKAASAYCAGTNSIIINAGVNGIFPTIRFPKIVNDIIKDPAAATKTNANDLATNDLVEDEKLTLSLEIVKSGLFFSIFCDKVAETAKANERSVDETLSTLFSRYFKTDSTSETQATKFSMKDLNADFGLASSNSKPDFVHTTTLENGLRVALAVMEFKDTGHAPLEQMGQAFSIGCNVICSHVWLGLKWSKCAIPLVLTTGNLYQFAWVTLLKPLFPVLHVTSGVLDASIPYARKQIAENLLRVKEYCSRVEKDLKLIGRCHFTPVTQLDQTDLYLNVAKYHHKLFKDTFLRWNDKPEESLGYIWQIYEQLADVDEAVLPLCFANLKRFENPTVEKTIIFPKLEPEFKMGVPSNKDLFALYLVKLKEAIKKIHAKGVIHIDLYPSNILWRVHEGTEDKIVIRIVDWDAATFTNDSFTDRMKMRLKDKNNSAYYWKSNGTAEARCDYWFLFVVSNLTDEERAEMNGSQATVNEVYRNSVTRQRHDDKLLDDSFQEWYNSQVP